MTEQISFNIDAAYDERAEYVKDMAAVEAQERKRQREQDGPEDIDPEVLVEWELQAQMTEAQAEEDSRYFIDGYDGDDFPDEDLGHGDWCEGDPDEWDGE